MDSRACSLGVFHDNDPHAQRLINIGMAFAYRHIEMDLVAVANARVMNDMERAVQDSMRGRLVVDAGLGQDALADQVAGKNERMEGNAPVQGCPSTFNGAVGTSGTTLAVGAPFAGVLLDGVHPGQLDSSVVAPTAGSDDPEEPEIGSQWYYSQATQRQEVGQDTQPILAPTPQAIASVRGVLSSMSMREDAGEAAKALLFNALLLFGRECAIKAGPDSVPSREPSDNQCWEAIAQRFSKWWPVWNAPRGERCRPVPGTAGFLRNPSRVASSSRWCYIVNIAGVHDAWRKLKLR